MCNHNKIQTERDWHALAFMVGWTVQRVAGEANLVDQMYKNAVYIKLAFTQYKIGPLAKLKF